MAERSTGGTEKKIKGKLKASLLLLLIAAISACTATYAWFSIANNVAVQYMEIRVGVGAALRARAGSAGGAIEDYYAELKGSAEAANTNPQNMATALQLTGDGAKAAFSEIKLWPVSSGTGTAFYTQNHLTTGAATTAESLYYAELDLHFRSNVPMRVYLNGEESSPGANDQTTITALKDDGFTPDTHATGALRISFEDVATGATVIYEPLHNGDTVLVGQPTAGTQAAIFSTLGSNAGLANTAAPATKTTPLFTIPDAADRHVKVRIWIEGADEDCKDGNGTDPSIDIQKDLLRLQFRFSGASLTDDAAVEIVPTP